jgi:hypothetical protein
MTILVKASLPMERALVSTNHVAMLQDIAQTLQYYSMLGTVSLLVNKTINNSDLPIMYEQVPVFNHSVELRPRSFEELAYKAMLLELTDILRHYSMTGAISLLINGPVRTPDQSAMLIRTYKPDGTIELHPCPLEELGDGDILYITRCLNPGDTEFMDYVASPHSGHGNCATSQKKQGGDIVKRHIYVKKSCDGCSAHKKGGTKHHNYR